MQQSSSSEVLVNAGGHAFNGYLAWPASQPRYGVVVLHSWWGLSLFFREFCDRLAGEGLAAFAPDLNRGRIAGTIEEAKSLMNDRDFAATQAIVLGSGEVLRDRLRGEATTSVRVPVQPLGVVGFSMGAAWALVLASQAPDDISCGILYYGVEGVDFSKVRASFLGHYAEDDEWTPIRWAQQLEADMRETGLEVTFHSYPGVGHWFCEADRPDAYSPAAAQLAWERTIRFLHDHLDQRA
jgi:carboxymethylenebutenolidase